MEHELQFISNIFQSMLSLLNIFCNPSINHKKEEN